MLTRSLYSHQDETVCEQMNIAGREGILDQVSLEKASNEVSIE